MTVSLFKKTFPLIGISFLAGCCLPTIILAEKVGEISATILGVDLAAGGEAISPELFGIFYEDLNYAADGGLYAELVQNRSFEYSPDIRGDWDALTAWEAANRSGTESLVIETATPIHENNPHYAVLGLKEAGAGVRNFGFDGIPVKAGEAYDFSLFTRQIDGHTEALAVRLEKNDGSVLAEADLPTPGVEWQRLAVALTPAEDDAEARLVVFARGQGRLGLDMISLFPQKTFHNRHNGLRADLAQVIADLQPKFMRFPGGCLVHGYGLDNMYNWKDTIGPVEQRKGQRNIWKYYQSVGLGYYEYFQFCEDIGAIPLPVVAAGVCCQNSNVHITGKWGEGQEGLPMSEMDDYVQDVLDLIEWANGPVASEWGAKRAAAGHPEPFNLKYLGVGNEDHITPVFKERFVMIYEAVKAKHPEIVVIGTVGPNPDGYDYEEGWKIADELHIPVVDEHCYKSPQWFWDNLERYDSYDRSRSKIYLGEYAVHDDHRRNTLRSALAEAAYMTALERNGDIVVMSSYAPLLARRGNTQWTPDLIYFTNKDILLSVNYYVQQLFSTNSGDVWLPTSVKLADTASSPDSLILGTWKTQAEFSDISLTDGSATLLQPGSADWKAESGSWEIRGDGYAQMESAQPALSRLAISSNSPSYTLTLKARKTGGSEGFLIGFGGADPSDYYWWNLGGWNNSQHGVEQSVNGVWRIASEFVSGEIKSDRWYDIKIQSDGERIQCYLDGVLIHDIPVRNETLFAASCVKDSRTGDVILKIVNGNGAPKPLNLELAGADQFASTAALTVLGNGDQMAINDFNAPRFLPETSTLAVGHSFDYEAPPYSLSVIRIKPR